MLMRLPSRCPYSSSRGYDATAASSSLSGAMRARLALNDHHRTPASCRDQLLRTLPQTTATPATVIALSEFRQKMMIELAAQPLRLTLQRQLAKPLEIFIARAGQREPPEDHVERGAADDDQIGGRRRGGELFGEMRFDARGARSEIDRRDQPIAEDHDAEHHLDQQPQDPRPRAGAEISSAMRKALMIANMTALSRWYSVYDTAAGEASPMSHSPIRSSGTLAVQKNSAKTSCRYSRLRLEPGSALVSLLVRARVPDGFNMINSTCRRAAGHGGG